MKIRKKITLWISGTTLLATISFSTFIVFELVELPFSLIDKELQHISDSLIETNKNLPDNNSGINVSNLPYNPDHYWIRVSNENGTLLYQSAIARYTDIPPSGDKKSYNVERNIPRNQIWLGQDSHDDIAFRVRVTEGVIGHQPANIIIAKPIEDIEEEFISIFYEYTTSLFLCTLFIIVISYKLAGKILQPLSSISFMAKEISEKSLNKRLPLSKTHDELYDLSRALNNMFDRLQYSFEKQKEFISNASHELKSPLTLLKLAQEDLLINHELPPLVRINLDRQINTTFRISKLVKNLLDLSRLEQLESLSVERVDIKEILEHVVDEYADLLQVKNISVTCQFAQDMVIQGDPEKLVRLFVNLLENGIRYNYDSGGIIKISGKKQKDLLSVELLNTGHPIPENDLERIFEQFYRVEKSRSITHGGSGLGLTIVKKIIELHDGSIIITNEGENLIKVAIFLPITSRNHYSSNSFLPLKEN